jgi:hypothetical protein
VRDEVKRRNLEKDMYSKCHVDIGGVDQRSQRSNTPSHGKASSEKVTFTSDFN